MKTREFNYDFGEEGEFIRHGLKVFGNRNVEYTHSVNRVHHIYVCTFVGSVPDFLEMDFEAPRNGRGLFDACQRDLEEL